MKKLTDEKKTKKKKAKKAKSVSGVLSSLIIQKMKAMEKVSTIDAEIDEITNQFELQE